MAAISTPSEDDQKPMLIQTEPILAVKNIPETVDFWHEEIGFPEKWMWGEPPDHGGVTWYGAANIQFTLYPELASRSQGNNIWIRTKNLQALHEMHAKKNIVVSHPEDKPWGFTQYVVKDNNGYYLHFAESTPHKMHSRKTMADTVRIVERRPTVSEYLNLVKSVGWDPPKSISSVEAQLKTAVHVVVAEDSRTNEAIGCAFLLGDNAIIYYIKDVIVHPDWQNQRIGTAIVRKLTDFLEKHGAKHATVALFTRDRLVQFYRQFGFKQAFGMMR